MSENDFKNTVTKALAGAVENMRQQNAAFRYANCGALPGVSANLNGRPSEDPSRTVQQLLRAMSIPCRFDNSGCGGTGYKEIKSGGTEGVPDRREVCPLCGGRKRGIDTGAALELVSYFVDLLTGGEMHEDATPEALQAWNQNAAKECAENLVALRKRQAQEAEELRIYKDAQKQIDRVRGGLPPESAPSVRK